MFNSLQPGFSTGNILSKSEIRKRLQLMGIDPNKKNSDKNKNAKLSLNEEYNLAIQNPENLEKIKKEIEEDKEINNIKLEEIKKDFSNRKMKKQVKKSLYFLKKLQLKIILVKIFLLKFQRERN